MLQLNIEGLTIAKLEVVQHLAESNKVAAVLLQETHCTDEERLKLPGFHLTGSIYSRRHGLATFVRADITWTDGGRSSPDSSVQWLITKIQETSVVNVYKPPPSPLTTSALPLVLAPAIYAGDFNCQHIDWGYSHTSADGEALSEWASNADALLLYDPKEHPSFHSSRWNTHTNPDLAFAAALTPHQRDASSTDSPDPTTARPSSRSPRWCNLSRENQSGDGTLGRPTGSYSRQRQKKEQSVSRSQTPEMWMECTLPTAMSS